MIVQLTPPSVEYSTTPPSNWVSVRKLCQKESILSGFAAVVAVLAEVSKADDVVVISGANQAVLPDLALTVELDQAELVPDEVKPPVVLVSRLSFSTESMIQPVAGAFRVMEKLLPSPELKEVAGKVRILPLSVPAGLLLTYVKPAGMVSLKVKVAA